MRTLLGYRCRTCEGGGRDRAGVVQSANGAAWRNAHRALRPCSVAALALDTHASVCALGRLRVRVHRLGGVLERGELERPRARLRGEEERRVSEPLFPSKKNTAQRTASSRRAGASSDEGAAAASLTRQQVPQRAVRHHHRAVLLEHRLKRGVVVHVRLEVHQAAGGRAEGWCETGAQGQRRGQPACCWVPTTQSHPATHPTAPTPSTRPPAAATGRRAPGGALLQVRLVEAADLLVLD